jgi:hypothetical protein
VQVESALTSKRNSNSVEPNRIFARLFDFSDQAVLNQHLTQRTKGEQWVEIVLKLRSIAVRNTT